jgi:integrase
LDFHSRQQICQNPYTRFIYSIKSPQTKKRYPDRFRTFLDFAEIEGEGIEERLLNFYDIAKANPQWLQDSLLNFFIYQKERVSRGEITTSTISNYYKPVKLFCEVNDILINWKFISRGIPRGKHASDDRAPTLEEIHQLLKYPDVRIKPIVLFMISSGVRIGAWDYLKWKHITPCEDEANNVIAAKVIVYAGEPEQYYCFITSEAYHALEFWMQYRSSYGEKISGESWVMRNLWKTTNIPNSARTGSAVSPIRLKNEAVRTLLCRALLNQNIRTELKRGQRHHEFKSAHGFRKYFKTHCENIMGPANIELLMGHDIGLSKSYYKPTEKKLLEDYLKASDLLTIDEENKLRRKVDELTKIKDEEYVVIKNKLSEKDEIIQKIQEQHKLDIRSLREEMENRFEQFFSKINYNELR